MSRYSAVVLLVVALLGFGTVLADEVAEAEIERPVKKIKMVAQNWKWSPNVIRVKQGTHLVIDFDSYDASHSFEIKKLKIKVPLPEGDKGHLELDVDFPPGEYKWRCGRPCGDGCAKMRGKLIVEE